MDAFATFPSSRAFDRVSERASDHASSEFAERAWLRRLAVPGVLPGPNTAVIARDVLVEVTSVSAIAARADEQARQQRDAAQADCDTMLAEARTHSEQMAFDAAIDAQRQVWYEASDLLQLLEQERSAMRDQACRLLQALATSLCGKLLLDVPETAPALSSVRLLVDAWNRERPVGQASLSIHPDDIAPVTPVLAAVPGWQLQPNVALPRGACVLAYEGIEMHASFTANVAALAAGVAGMAALDEVLADVEVDVQADVPINRQADGPAPQPDFSTY